MSVKVQVIFYSMYGHIYKMAEAIAAGAREFPGAEVSLFQVAEHLPDNVLEQYGAKAAKASFGTVPVANVGQLVEADAIIFGTPTRFGNMAGQMRNFLDQTGQLWAKRSIDRKSRKRVCFDRLAARRPGDHHNQFSHDASTSRNGDRRRTVQPKGANEHGCTKWWNTVRRDHDCRQRRFASTERG